MKPTVFISSTFYDLKSERNELVKFFSDWDFNVTDNNRGDVPYSSSELPAETSVKYTDRDDFLVAIIGGNFGNQASNSQQSITMGEIKTAINSKRPVYVFIKRGVYTEHKFYEKNMLNSSVSYSEVTNIKIHEFISELKITNVVIQEFDVVSEIINYLRSQFSALMYELLIERRSKSNQKTLKNLEDLCVKLTEQIEHLSFERQTLSDRLSSNNLYLLPSVERLQKFLKISYSVFPANLSQWKELIEAYGFKIGLTENNYDLVYDKIILKEKTYSQRIKINTKNLFSEKGFLYLQPKLDEALLCEEFEML